MTMPDVRELVPHSGTMLLLDRVLSADTDNLCAEVTIHAGSTLAGEGGVGAWVGIEYMAQAIAAHAGWVAWQRSEAVKVGLLLGSRKYACGVPLFATGSVLRVHVHRVLQGENGLGAFDCRIDVVGGASGVATATVTVYQPANVKQFLEDGNVV
ncbi:MULTISPECIES: hotdog family protein [unclassified Duganella]|uniref:ApeP family dehydratase n=1 Tax=unclassified Duganella TaxID=2636909 RepID=UPI000E351C43|nr:MULTISPECIES: hotdog family protein [unclassified Duganella]RFP14537.1 3-hydroxylacyl-ACP dehydratase [Duganella sp. BJB475]RFP30886.1 3-hydroxylacyl-ACP dehydratase [Duganella sp. BJB476]